MDFSEKWGKDVDEAVRLALIDLNLTVDQVKVIVLEEPTKGFFGIGSKLAKVRVEKTEEKIEKTAKNEKHESPVKPNAPVKQDKTVKKEAAGAFNKDKTIEKKLEIDKDPDIKPERREKRRERPRRNRDGFESGGFVLREKPTDLVELEDKTADNFLKEITTKMGLDLTINVLGNDSCIYVNIEGKDSGTIIGKILNKSSGQ